MVTKQELKDAVARYGELCDQTGRAGSVSAVEANERVSLFWAIMSMIDEVLPNDN